MGHKKTAAESYLSQTWFAVWEKMTPTGALCLHLMSQCCLSCFLLVVFKAHDAPPKIFHVFSFKAHLISYTIQKGLIINTDHNKGIISVINSPKESLTSEGALLYCFF